MMKGINGGGDCSDNRATIEANKEIPRTPQRNRCFVIVPANTNKYHALESPAFDFAVYIATSLSLTTGQSLVRFASDFLKLNMQADILQLFSEESLSRACSKPQKIRKLVAFHPNSSSSESPQSSLHAGTFSVLTADVHRWSAVAPGHDLFKCTRQPNQSGFISKSGHELDPNG